MRRMLSILVLTSLLANMLTLTSNVHQIESRSDVNMNAACVPSCNMLRRFDAPNLERLQGLFRRNDESIELIIGVDVPESQVQSLKGKITSLGGEIIDTISTKENVRALATKVRLTDVYFLIEKLQTDTSVKYVEPNTKVNATYVPNDPYWPDQWGPQKIEADRAWNITTGSSDVLVAIVDTGIDYTHVDLAVNYVPLGYDWANNDTDPMDDNGHGTHCAGIVAAKLDNGLGIAGVAQVRIMAEKVLNSSGVGLYSWVAEGIIHATDCGAKIISMSLGGDEWSDLMHDAVRYAHEHDVLLVASAGNNANDVRHYPAAYDEVIAVTATDQSDNLAWFSSFGDWVELAAPGVDIYSTYSSNSYRYLSGTSTACPHVTGTATLAWSACPNHTRDEIRRLLQLTADDLGDEGFDPYFGHGRVNARKAVMGLPEHDLKLTGLRDLYRLDPGKLITFNLTISNIGRSNETNVIVQFFVNGTLACSTTINFLEEIASKAVNLSWSETAVGDYNVTCYVVPVLGENLTGNNVANAKIMIRFPMTLGVPWNYPTIKSALDVADDGDVVLVREGYYSEGQIDVRRDNISLVANGDVVLNNSRLNVRANHVTVKGFQIRYSPGYGIEMRGSNNVLVMNGLLKTQGGIRVFKALNCNVSQNKVIRPGSNPLIVEESSCCTISFNKVVSNCWYGLYVYQSFFNVISFNSITGALTYGFYLAYSQNNTVISNNVTDCIGSGLIIAGSSYNKFRNNTMAKNNGNFGIEFQGFNPIGWNPNDIDASNTVDGKPICYWVNERNRTVPIDTGCVVLINCENIKVENLILKNNMHGVLLINTNNTQIVGNNITRNRGKDPWFMRFSGGIHSTYGSSNTTIALNNIVNNQQGIWLWKGINNTVTQNNITSNWSHGIGCYSSNNVISLNNIAGNLVGVEVNWCSNVTVSLNNMMGNDLELYGSNHTASQNNIMSGYDGIVLCASNCTIYLNNIIRCKRGVYVAKSSNMLSHNNFINNTQPFSIYQSVNDWDDGYPTGGNYWSSYNGTDLYSGPSQNETGSDGIGDTPYMLDTNNIDHYPLMTLYAADKLPQTCNLTVITAIGDVITPPSGYGNTTIPDPGTYMYVVGSMAVFEALPDPYYSVFDHWELDGVNIGSIESCTVLMDEDHILKAVFMPVQPLQVSISPAESWIKFGESVTFTSSVLGGKHHFEYQWFVNGSEALDGTSSVWTLTPRKGGDYRVYLIVTGFFIWTGQSNEALVLVLQGDINGDGKVDIEDLILVIKHYASYPGHVGWNPNADVNNDGKVDIKDLVLVVKHFGEHFVSDENVNWK